MLIAAGFGTAVMLLWNWLAPTIFGLGTINFWQALGLFVLCRILLGGFGGGHHHRHGGHHHRHGGHHHCHDRRHHHGGNPVHDKWMKMTPEQREEFISRRRTHFFGRGHFFADEDSGFNDGENTPKDPKDNA